MKLSWRFQGAVPLRAMSIQFAMNDGTRIRRLLLSEGPNVGNSALKSLLHRVVFESSTMTSSERANQIGSKMDSMLPTHHNMTFVTLVSSNDRPVVYGQHKSVAYFEEPEFGAKVRVSSFTIVLFQFVVLVHTF